MQMKTDSFPVQALYLLVYSSAVICAASTVMLRRKLSGPGGRAAGTLAVCSAVCTSLLSIQVFLGTAGFTDQLQPRPAMLLIFILNTIIAAGVSAAVILSLFLANLFRPAQGSGLINKTAAAAASAIFLTATALQTAALLFHSAGAAEVLGLVTAAATGGSLLVLVYSAVRIFIPIRNESGEPGFRSFRIFIASAVGVLMLLITAGGSIGTLAAPAGFILINTAVLILLRDISSKAPPLPVKSPETICRELGLSARETEVALLLSKGHSYKEIADILCISMSTTQTHTGRIYSKLGTGNKTELSNLLNGR